MGNKESKASAADKANPPIENLEEQRAMSPTRRTPVQMISSFFRGKDHEEHE